VDLHLEPGDAAADGECGPRQVDRAPLRRGRAPRPQQQAAVASPASWSASPYSMRTGIGSADGAVTAWA